jgi:anti-sigma28 factor (negative regulator of flagellin synthesis)
VLSSRKSELQPKKGKDYEISKWEDDVRKSLANKKHTSSAVLTKQEQALVQAQLEKESVIRQRVASIKASFGRGLRIIRSLVAAGNLDSKLFMSHMVPLLLEGAFHSVLADCTSYDTYLVRLSIAEKALVN